MSSDNADEGINRKNENRQLALDVVLSTQPELGPSIPDGGYGWVIFLGTLFFQALVPCLLVNFGIILAFLKLENDTVDVKHLMFWDDRFITIPLFYCISKTLFDSPIRKLISSANTPRLISVVGTCLTCAGLLFVWIGITGKTDRWLFPPAGFLTGLGSAFILIQCDIILPQYFRAKLTNIMEYNRIASIAGFAWGPVILGNYLLKSYISHIILWYLAVLIQGLIVSLFFRKPPYMRRKPQERAYRFIQSNIEEEEMSANNSRELENKNPTETGSKIIIDLEEPGSSKKWVTFNDDEDDDEEEIKYSKTSDEEPSRSWERFEDDGESSPGIVNHLPLAEETKTPVPLFSDLPINNNESYAYDEEITTTPRDYVFEASLNGRRYLSILKEPSFYKLLLTTIANLYSNFMFFTLYPSYLYIKSDHFHMKVIPDIVGILSSIAILLLMCLYCFNIDKKRRDFLLGSFYWLSCIGYLFIADFRNDLVMIMGGLQVVSSIVLVDYVTKPLLKGPLRGGTTSEHTLLTVLSSVTLFIFLCINISFKTCFRIVGILHFITGTVWLINLLYKKLRAH